MRALITREYAEPLASMLATRRVSSIHVPCIRLVSTGNPCPVDCFESVLITSAAVVRFVPDVKNIIGSAKVFAVGHRTAASLTSNAVEVTYAGNGGGLEALEYMLAQTSSNQLHIGAKDPSPGLKLALMENRIDSWAVYKNTVPAGLQGELSQCMYDAVVFTSGSAVRAYVDAVGTPTVPTVMLGRSTCSRAEALGVEATAVAREPTLEALVDAVAGIR